MAHANTQENFKKTCRVNCKIYTKFIEEIFDAFILERFVKFPIYCMMFDWNYAYPNDYDFIISVSHQ